MIFGKDRVEVEKWPKTVTEAYLTRNDHSMSVQYKWPGHFTATKLPNRAGESDIKQQHQSNSYTSKESDQQKFSGSVLSSSLLIVSINAIVSINVL